MSALSKRRHFAALQKTWPMCRVRVAALGLRTMESGF